MARRVLIHAGAPKTGTSYLESIIWSQRDRLEADGIFLPGTSRTDHDALMGDVRGGVFIHPDSIWTWDHLCEIVASRTDDVLVSKEMLAGAHADQAASAIERLGDQEIHLIVTARQLAASLPSAWQQAVKGRAKVPFGEWLDALRADPSHGFWRHQDPISILQRWAPDFPAERVHVITMPRSSSDPAELWRRFAGVIGVNPDDYSTPDRPANESLGAVEIEVLRRVNVALGDRLPMRVPYLGSVNRNLTGPVLMPMQPKVKFGVPARHHGWLVERAQQMIDELAAYPCQVIGDLDDLVAAPQDLTSPDDVSEAELLDASVAAMAEMLVKGREEVLRARQAPEAPSLLRRVARRLR